MVYISCSNIKLAHGARKIINAGHEVVIVAMNYRMFSFGFLPSEKLLKEDSLNVGIWDVAAAFRWVRKYIYEFGGDPVRNITKIRNK